MRDDRVFDEARRVLNLCNACGYCNGYCDLFEASRRVPHPSDADLEHLAHLCHACRNCLYACQYAPPHPFAVNVPRTLAALRLESFAEHVWPRALGRVFAHGTAVVTLFTTLMLLAWLAAAFTLLGPERLFSVQQGPGSFYRLVPWWLMTLLGALPLAFSVMALGISLRRFWRRIAPADRVPPGIWLGATLDVLRLRNLSGGGAGCNDLDEGFSPWRRRFHQSLLSGFLLCLAATLIATVYHHVLGWQAPYPLFSLPVLLGTLGGVALAAGTAGLAGLEMRGNPQATTSATHGADLALALLVCLVAVSGLALLALRETAAMGMFLSLHLGSVCAFFLLLPYSKFVHGGYRFLTLVREAMEQRHRASGQAEP